MVYRSALALYLAVLLGCAAQGIPDEPIDRVPPSEQPDGGFPGPPPNCVPDSCDDRGAECGTIATCGELVECGECAGDDICGGGGTVNVCGSGAACVPQSCEQLAAQCGRQDDGCGGTVECGGCEAGLSCTSGMCSAAACDDKNECGGCGALPMSKGQACPCEGTATCTAQGMECSDGGTVDLGATDDGYDDWTSVSGIAEVSTGFDRDIYTIQAEDRLWSDLAPKFEYVHPGGYSARVCASVKGIDTSLLASCAVFDSFGDILDDIILDDAMWTLDGPVGCCKDVGPDDAGAVFGLRFLNWSPFFDFTADYTLAVTARDQGKNDSCASYELRYVF